MVRPKMLVFVALAAALSVGTASADGISPCGNYWGGSDLGPCVTLTFYGTVTSGTDDVGYFGTPGADLSGKSFSMAFGINWYEADTYGGGVGDALLNGTVTISSGSLTVQSYEGGYLALSGNSAWANVSDSDGTSDELGAYVSSSVNPFVPPQDYIPLDSPPSQADFLTVPFSYDLQPGDSGGAGVKAGADLAYCPPYFCGPVDNLGMSINRVTLDIGNESVPEPATWMMVLIAVGSVMLVRQRGKRGFRFHPW